MNALDAIDRVRETTRALQRERLRVPPLADLLAIEPTVKTFVYFVRCGVHGPIKIGVASDVADRLSALQVGCPYTLELMGTIPGGTKTEGALHRAFAGFRMRGEWFCGCPEIRKAVRGLLGKVSR